MKRVILTRPLRSTPAYVRKSKQSGNNPYPPPLPFRGEGGGGTLPRQEKKKDHGELDTILVMAESLPITELNVLLAKLALRAQILKGGEDRDVDMWAQAVYSGLQSIVGYAEGAGQGPLVVKRVLAVPAAWAPVSDFMRSSKLDQRKVVERQGVYVMLAKLVIAKAQYIAQKGGAPLSAKLVGSCASNVATIFDQAFPGYLENGLAWLVAKQLVAVKD